MKMAVKIVTLAVISVVLYFAFIIAYEHPLGNITGFISSAESGGNTLVDYVSFIFLSVIIVGLFVVAWIRHRKGKRKA